MAEKPTYEELEQMVQELEREAVELKKTAEALRESDNGFRALSENANDGILIALGQGVHVYANRKAADTTGYSVSELLKTSIKDLAHPDEFEKIIGRFKRRLEGKPAPIRYETVMIRKDRKSVPVELTAAKTVWQGQAADIAIFRDITERKKAEEAVKEAEQLYRSLIDNAQDAIFVADGETGMIEDANQAAQTMLGRSLEEIKRMHQSEVVAPDEAETAKQRFQKILEEDKVGAQEYHMVSAEGHRRHVEARPNAIEVNGRKLVTAFFRDITERKRAEEALKEKEKFLTDIFSSIQDSIAVFDKDLNILMTNPYPEKWFPHKMPLVGKKCYEAYHDRTEPCEICPSIRTLNSGKPDFDVIPLVTEEGTYWFETYTFPLYDFKTGQMSGVIEYVRDITDRKQAQEKIKASLKEKEVLLREIHHRVKNNFQIISSLLDMIKMRTQNQEAIGLLTGARSKIYTMALVHTQLYEEDRFDQVDMASHIRKLVEYLSQAYSGKGVAISPVTHPSDVVLTLNQAIPCALALNEVISNVYKHAFKEGQRGTIEISVRRTDDDMVVISVKDDGMGIPEEVDIDKTKTLGLKLVRNLVEGQLNGRVEINRDNGTEIIIEFTSLKEGGDHA